MAINGEKNEWCRNFQIGRKNSDYYFDIPQKEQIIMNILLAVQMDLHKQYRFVYFREQARSDME